MLTGLNDLLIEILIALINMCNTGTVWFSLDECMIKYEFVDVDLLDGEERKAILADVKKFNPRCSFPTVIIGDEVIVGYKEDKIKEALGL